MRSRGAIRDAILRRNSAQFSDAHAAHPPAPHRCDAGDVFTLPANIEKTFDQISNAVAHVAASGSFPVILGGDHSIGFPTVRGLAIEGGDALIWQLAASVALPGYTIHQLVAIVVALLDASGVDQTGVISALPTACGLAMIPFIVKPLDELAEVAMDVTFRKVSAPYLESCEV